MADEIKPVNVPGIRRVRHLSKDRQGENDEEFQKKLAALVQDESEQQEPRGRPPAPPAQPERDPGAQADKDQDALLGGNLDMST